MKEDNKAAEDFVNHYGVGGVEAMLAVLAVHRKVRDAGGLISTFMVDAIDKIDGDDVTDDDYVKLMDVHNVMKPATKHLMDALEVLNDQIGKFKPQGIAKRSNAEEDLQMTDQANPDQKGYPDEGDSNE